MQLNQELKQKLFSDIQRMAHQLLEIKTPSGIVAQFSKIQSLYEKASYLKMDAEWSTMAPHTNLAKESATIVMPEVILPKFSPEPSLALEEAAVVQNPSLVPPLDSEDHLAIKLADFEDDFLKPESAVVTPAQQSSGIENQLPWLKPQAIKVSNEIEFIENKILSQAPSLDEMKPAPEMVELPSSIITHEALDLPFNQASETAVAQIAQNVSRETFAELNTSNTEGIATSSQPKTEANFKHETSVSAPSIQSNAEFLPQEPKGTVESKFKLSHIKGMSSNPEPVPEISNQAEAKPSSEPKTQSISPSLKSYLFPQKIVLDLNDKMAFEQHLFANEPSLLKACIDELNQFQSEEGSKQFLTGFLTQNSINLQNEYAQRLFQLIENKFKA